MQKGNRKMEVFLAKKSFTILTEQRRKNVKCRQYNQREPWEFSQQNCTRIKKPTLIPNELGAQSVSTCSTRCN